MKTPLKSWRINERHYGNLQGLNKKETVEKFGKEQVHIWRRSYDVPPPLAEEDYVNDINQQIEEYQKEEGDFLTRIQNKLCENYKKFNSISNQLRYLKKKGLFEDLNPEEFKTFKSGLKNLFLKKDLTNEERELLNQDHEYLKVRGESLKDTLNRVIKWLRLEYLTWKSGECVLIVAHGNSLRAMVKLLDQMTKEAVLKLNIPTGSPIFYDLKGLDVQKKDFGESEEVLKARAQKVAEQTGK